MLSDEQEDERMMRTQWQMRKALYDQAALFNWYFRRGNYLDAALAAENLSMICLFCGVDEKTRAELLEDTTLDEPVEAVIKSKYRLEASWWCVLHGYAERLLTYQNIDRIIRKEL
jgi:hypothetical protein